MTSNHSHLSHLSSCVWIKTYWNAMFLVILTQAPETFWFSKLFQRMHTKHCTLFYKLLILETTRQQKLSKSSFRDRLPEQWTWNSVSFTSITAPQPDLLKFYSGLVPYAYFWCGICSFAEDSLMKEWRVSLDQLFTLNNQL